ncbi:Transcriptional adapter 1 [Xenoophorus captivus]|uniref:Transcriptional adapter 1 n=1 Tax=Xenoophorus captivus TaxID=1517983 RepID=A0ABV0QBU1_9TELE
MAGHASELEIAKKNLTDAIGDNVKHYWANLKLWFKQKISKEEFDVEARRLLPQENVHIHNDFLLAILTRCQIIVSTPGEFGVSTRQSVVLDKQISWPTVQILC